MDRLFPRTGSTAFDATHYDLRLNYVPRTQRLRGRAIVTARATRSLPRVELDFQGLRVSRVRVNGRAASFSRRAATLIVRPRGGALRAEGRFTVEVAYAGVPRPMIDSDGSREGWIATNDGAHVVGEPRGAQSWFPSNNLPRDKATLDLRMTVPAGIAVIGNGSLVSRRSARGRTTWHWRERHPIATYLTTATLGRFAIARSSVGNVRFFDAVDSSITGEERAATLRTLARQPAIVESFAARYGPYPFDYAGAAVDRTNAVSYALESQSISNYHSPPPAQLVAHELAHQWFGNSVTPSEWSDIWLNEGFATWVQWDWIHRHDGDPVSPAERSRSFYQRDADDPLWSVPVARPASAREMFHEATYVRGAMTLEGLRQTVGEQTFLAILRAWTSENRYGNVTTADFTALAERISGQDLDAYFQDWLYDADKPAPLPEQGP